MSERQRIARAIVRVVVEVGAGTWGPECTLAQATRQAEDDALAKLRRLLGAEPLGAKLAGIEKTTIIYEER